MTRTPYANYTILRINFYRLALTRGYKGRIRTGFVIRAMSLIREVREGLA